VKKVEKNSFDLYVSNFITTGKSFVVETKRNVNSLYYRQQLVLMTKNKNKRFKNNKSQIKTIINLFAQVQKNINIYIKQVDFIIIKVEKRFGSSKTDREKWRKMEDGEVFYYIDISHCFWRIAFLKGYIGKNLYEKVLTQPELKVQRNMSLALIVAPRERTYYRYGVRIANIIEDKRMYRTIYDNIRFIAYNMMGDCMEVSKNNFIAYRTDGIMIDKAAINKVKKLIDDKGFNYTVKQCFKKDNHHYVIDGDNEIRKF